MKRLRAFLVGLWQALTAPGCSGSCGQGDYPCDCERGCCQPMPPPTDGKVFDWIWGSCKKKAVPPQFSRR